MSVKSWPARQRQNRLRSEARRRRKWKPYRLAIESYEDADVKAYFDRLYEILRERASMKEET